MQLSSGAENSVYCSPWLGNIRELANAIERAAVVAHGEARDLIETRDLFPQEERETPSYQEAMRRFQRGLVENALSATDWNVPAAADRLDVSRAYLYRLIQTFGLKRS
jgi:transcriptional regulator of acetoin/glycerol metabolism